MIDLHIAGVHTFRQSSPFSDVQIVHFHCGCNALVVGAISEVFVRIWCKDYHFMNRSLPKCAPLEPNPVFP